MKEGKVIKREAAIIHRLGIIYIPPTPNNLFIDFVLRKQEEINWIPENRKASK